MPLQKVSDFHINVRAYILIIAHSHRNARPFHKNLPPYLSTRRAGLAPFLERSDCTKIIVRHHGVVVSSATRSFAPQTDLVAAHDDSDSLSAAG